MGSNIEHVVFARDASVLCSTKLVLFVKYGCICKESYSNSGSHSQNVYNKGILGTRIPDHFTNTARTVV